MSRRISKVAVLGSGVMGMGIAAHCANIGLEVLLLDIVPFDLSEEEKQNPAARNRLADQALKAAVKAKKIEPFYDPAFASRVSTGNFEDDFHKIADCDWIIEVVVERLDIKQKVFAQVEKYRKAGAIVSSNTSGIPISMMLEGRSEDFQKNFCGTHFFNPPRYLQLLEIIPTKKTDPALIDFFMDYGSRFLGKQTVLCKDTPAFIANRVGVYAMAKIFQLTEELGLSIEEVDQLTGPALGRPKTGTFALADLVGLDTAEKVIKGIKDNCPTDEQAAAFEVPAYLQFLLENKFFGNKTKKGFYERTRQKDENGRNIKLALNLATQEYAPAQRVKTALLGDLKNVSGLAGKVKTFFKDKYQEDKGAELVRRSLLGLFAYVSNRIPEISDQLYSIDDALRAGFAWKVGPFQYWDMIGLEKAVELAEADGQTVAAWVKEMIAAGHTSFYKVVNGVTNYYNVDSKSYQPVPGAEQSIILDNIRDKSVVWENSDVQLHDIGDQVLCLEFRSYQNTLGEGVVRGVMQAIEIAEQGDWRGLVIGNNATNFSVGANLMLIAQMAYEQDFDELNMAIHAFQQMNMRVRYSSIPVVVATQGFTFGGGCEMAMHADAVIASAESYIGLVEVGVGLIPGGAGTKEFALRASDSFHKEDVYVPKLIDRFKTIAMASVATSAPKAFNEGYLRHGIDQVSVNASLTLQKAKQKVIALANAGYVQPASRNDIEVLGRGGLGALYVAAESLRLGRYASDHDIKIAKKVAYVLCGGDLSAQQKVSEQYLLDIEREAFLQLCGEQKTLERIQAMLTTGKPLRN
ncbi:3-hydroxyacyl-CoA dehydrogenase/enoyl-CoA hydratase family protein [Saprospira sp. CCB-QB6]|uniref:3-hydroxyacyl-CoA dehydrogenase/enoyl-CoA hydratase family protein n=1 Tax=Saprospira sp. CCB-QB6 TaxID=3023936 RepID=UPI00234B7338|nr:3-hydroxyacyl-CoA dehydrogenase/enoyl-CoA hydratase family protein [Saprospira sp. CCB-QB6]WCL80204.1 3-hydroxyacyl-CoA dehydrogenase/enoyl-CoA hydratase family protein [Saprospira sp. CCB-QB6]